MEASSTNQNDLTDNNMSVLSDIARKANGWTVLADLSDEEMTTLDAVALTKIITADFPEIIRKLKLESYAKFLITLEEEIKIPLRFRPTPSMIFKLNEIIFLGTKSMKADARRVKTNLINVVSQEIARKYHADTPLIRLSDGEYSVLLTLRPLIDDMTYPGSVLALHWRVIENKLDKILEQIEADHNFEVENVRWLIRLQRDINTPEFVRNKAQKLRKLNEKNMIERMSEKYDSQSSVDDLTENEKLILDRLDVIRNSYPPVIEYLHWNVAHEQLCKEFDDFKAGKLAEQSMKHIPNKLKFLMTNDYVPDKTKEIAKEFNQTMIHR